MYWKEFEGAGVVWWWMGGGGVASFGLTAAQEIQ